MHRNAILHQTWLAVARALVIVALAALASSSAAAVEPGEGYAPAGQLRTRTAAEIPGSNWSVGAETMDRDYTVYANWRQHLGPLGAKRARLQSGWAKTEKEPGKYDWAWMDAIIPDMAAQGVKPWVCLCYGNPIYPGGGGTGLGATLISSPEAWKAWEAYVAAFVDRYGKFTDEWEIWNEPKGKPEPYAELVVRTAAVLRARQPKARTIVAAGGSFDVKFVDALLAALKEQGRLDLVNEVAYHPYATNPDSSYARVEDLRKTIAKYSDKIGIRQGENGAPSQKGSFGALATYDWTEALQAKWATRRLLGDLGRDVLSSYFSICDMAYRVKGRSDAGDPAGGSLLVNYKGLLAIREDKTVDHVKPAYRAMQHVTAVFDNTLERVRDAAPEVTGGAESGKFAAFLYRSKSGGQVLALWRSSDSPGKNEALENVTVTVPGGRFTEPMWVDVAGGKVFKMDAGLWTQDGGKVTLRRAAVYDSAVLIADRSVLPLAK
jgi:hypothetical protein